jgi:hypothetical protein
VQVIQVLAVRDDGLGNLREIVAQRDLAAGQVYPRELVGLAKELLDFLERQLADRLLLPDLAVDTPGLASIRRDERQLVGKAVAPDVRLQDVLCQANDFIDRLSGAASTRVQVIRVRGTRA